MEKDKSKNRTKKTKTAKYRIDIERLSLAQDRLTSLEGLAAFLALPGVCDDRPEGIILLLGQSLRDARADLEAGRGDVIERWFESGEHGLREDKPYLPPSEDHSHPKHAISQFATHGVTFSSAKFTARYVAFLRTIRMDKTTYE